MSGFSWNGFQWTEEVQSLPRQRCQRAFELALADVAPRADHIGDDVDAQPYGDSSIHGSSALLVRWGLRPRLPMPDGSAPIGPRTRNGGGHSADRRSHGRTRRYRHASANAVGRDRSSPPRRLPRLRRYRSTLAVGNMKSREEFGISATAIGALQSAWSSPTHCVRCRSAILDRLGPRWLVGVASCRGRWRGGGGFGGVVR